ncbi:NADPH-dependent FMN reductase [Paenibacillus filicis]|uniref:NADPH-dependent FMN reductase n=1 Tax=Paenibacillus filicis TaxID=669464 RepID=A0ABU9DSK2_9BACL
MMTERTLRICSISGSLRSRSSHTALLEAAAELAPAQMQLTLYEGLADLPPFNPELDIEPYPAAVEQFRERLRASDGVLICTPEYANALPGVLKNALDWLVSSAELYDKPIGLISASPSPQGGVHAFASLVLVLTMVNARIAEGATLLIPKLSGKLDGEGRLSDPVTSEAVKALLLALERTIRV